MAATMYAYAKDVNISALDETLRASSLAELFDGVVVSSSTSPQTVAVWMTAALTPAQQSDFDALIAAHNPVTLSTEQLVEVYPSNQTITGDIVIPVAKDISLYFNHTTPITVTMPENHDGQLVIMKDISNSIVGPGEVLQNPVTIVTPGADTIDGLSQFVIDRNKMSVMIFSDGDNFHIV